MCTLSITTRLHEELARLVKRSGTASLRPAGRETKGDRTEEIAPLASPWENLDPERVFPALELHTDGVIQPLKLWVLFPSALLRSSMEP